MAQTIADLRAARIRRRLAHADTNGEVQALNDQLVTQEADRLFTFLRSKPVSDWLTDDALRDATRAFARVAVDAASREPTDTGPAPA